MAAGRTASTALRPAWRLPTISWQAPALHVFVTHPVHPMKRLLALLLALVIPAAHAVDWQESEEIAALFKARKLNGTFVLYDVAGNRLIGHNRTRGQVRYIPASTFKIPNSLIGLAAGSVGGVDVVLPYGGKPQPLKEWEQDLSLRDAIRISSVPIYQELARRTGLARMRAGIAALQYGNEQIGSHVDRFWLDGPLKISALEQVEFLARFGQLQLPYPRPVQLSVREIIFLETGDHWALYGKTGWATPYKPGIGWWVGWVQKGDEIYAFALNIDMPGMADGPKRIELGKACLKTLGVLPADYRVEPAR
ncbi:MAG: class D beta-lactamase [Rhodocyclaceae bacterium]|nr:class D beta-lactamase [Rhodocyclaceae bacterium]